MRIAFQHFGGDDWAAGNTFLESMLLALRALGPACPTLILVVGEHTPEQDYRPLLSSIDQVVRAEIQAPDVASLKQISLRYHLLWWLRARLLKLPPPAEANPLTAILPRHDIDAFFSVAWTHVPITSVPTVVWIPDFQHRRMPGNHPLELLASRDRVYSAQARAASRLLLTSEDVRHDLEAFDPAASVRARVVQFVANVPGDVYDQDPMESLARYHLPNKFVYMPNQFWKHKNHKMAFEVLARLQARGVRPCVVSTGNPFDYRDLGYFADLTQLLSRLDIRDQFIYLGLVPRMDMFRLMRQSVCILNPTLFEGLGMSAAESKSLGKKILVSDLAPFREQSVPGAAYFKPDDVDELADKLEAIWKTTPPGPDRELESGARAALPGRQAAFGRALADIFEEARAEFHNRVMA